MGILDLPEVKHKPVCGANQISKHIFDDQAHYFPGGFGKNTPQHTSFTSTLGKGSRIVDTPPPHMNKRGSINGFTWPNTINSSVLLPVVLCMELKVRGRSVPLPKGTSGTCVYLLPILSFARWEFGMNRHSIGSPEVRSYFSHESRGQGTHSLGRLNRKICRHNRRRHKSIQQESAEYLIGSIFT